MTPRFIFVHGNGTTHWSFGWSAWLKDQLDARGYQTFFETMPDSVMARAEYWLSFLEKQVQVGKHDVLIGWSSGGTAAMRYAERHAICGSILIAPSYTDLDDELEKQSGYFDKPWQWDVIAKNQQKVTLFYGDDDPYIPQADFAFIGESLHADVHKIHGAGHFMQPELPELLAYILREYPLDTNMQSEGVVSIVYTNWRGETATRRIIPIKTWFGSTEWHPQKQWLLTAYDVQKDAARDFALADITNWKA